MGAWFFWAFAAFVFHSLTSAFIYARVRREETHHSFLLNPLPAYLWGLLGLCLAPPAFAWLAFAIHPVLAIPICTLISFGTMLLPVMVIAEKWSLWLLMPGGARPIPKECQQALAAQARGDYELAERFYQAELTGDPKQDAYLNLGLGNLYRNQQRFEDTARAWTAALAGEMDSDVHLVTSLRLSQLLDERLHRIDEARTVLARAIALYPRDHETKDLRERLQALNRRHGRSPAAASAPPLSSMAAHRTEKG